MSIQSWKWRNIDSTFQFIIFSGNYSARSSQNALQWVNCRDLTRFPDPLWRHPSYGQVGSPSNPDLYGNSRMPSGHSRRTTELGRVECFSHELMANSHYYSNSYVNNVGAIHSIIKVPVDYLHYFSIFYNERIFCLNVVWTVEFSLSTRTKWFLF
jgi:hypothetical protein